MIDKKELKDYINKEVKDSVEANRDRVRNLDEWTKRFEALRSTACLDDDIKRKPWNGASNVGIPLDATVVYTLQARLIKATFGADPAITMRPNDLPHSEHLQRYINWQLFEEMRIYMDLLMGYQGMLIDGDKIFKTIIDKQVSYLDDETILYVDEHGEPYMSPETGSPVEAESEDHPSIFDPKTLKEYKPRKTPTDKERTTYYGPRLVNIPTKHLIVPTDADDTDCSKVRWICHEFWRPYGWIYNKSQQNPELFDKEAVRKLRKEKDQDRAVDEDEKARTLGIDMKTKTKMFRFYEWHGTYEDEKGRGHELIALMAPDQKQLMGYVPNRFYFRTGRRQFLHYTCFPQDGRFWGKGCVEWLRGIRSMLDALINSGLDRTALFSNPPMMFDEKTSGFDPAEHKFGPGKSWGLRDINKVKLLDLPSPENVSLVREEMMFSIVQRLFGINDYALGSAGQRGVGGHATATSKTASGINSVLNEGNIRFEVLIRQVQEVANPDLAMQTFKHFIMNRHSIMKEKGLNKPKEVFEPVMKLNEDELNQNFEYVFKGNTSTINPVQEQEQAVGLYKLFTESKNPFVVSDPDVIHDMTDMILNSYNVRGLKIKTKDEYRKMAATEPNKAKEVQEQAVRQAMGQGQQPGIGAK